MIHMPKAERFDKIMDILRRENGLPLQEIATLLHVSHMTVRRDLQRMAADGMVRLIHGGVVLDPDYASGHKESRYSLHSAETEHPVEKLRIGLRAAQLIQDSETLTIDVGSTTEYLAANIPSNLKLTVLAYALNIISTIAHLDNVTCISSGGTIHKDTLMFESPEGIALIRRYRATTAFISAAGISADFGVTCRNTYERETKRAVIEGSARKVLLADSSKFGRIRSDYFADLQDFDYVVTDTGLSSEYQTTITDLGIQLILA